MTCDDSSPNNGWDLPDFPHPQFGKLLERTFLQIDASVSGGGVNLGDIPSGAWNTDYAPGGQLYQFPTMSRVRAGHAMVSHNGALFALGGRDEDNAYVPYVEKYELGGSAWEVVQGDAVYIDHGEAVKVPGTSTVYIFRGTASAIYKYDLDVGTNTFVVNAGFNPESAVYRESDGLIYFGGGYNFRSIDTATNAITTLSDSPLIIADTTAMMDPGGDKILFWDSNRMWTYTVSTGVWSEPPAHPGGANLTNYSHTYDGVDTLWGFYGVDDHFTLTSFNIHTGEYHDVGDYAWCEAGHYGGDCIAYLDGTVHAFGGRDGGTYVREHWKYDVASNTWTQGNNINLDGTGRMVAVWDDRYMLVLGTDTAAGTVNSEVYDAVTDSWSNRASMFRIPYRSPVKVGQYIYYNVDYYQDEDLAFEYDTVNHTWRQFNMFTEDGWLGTDGTSLIQNGNREYNRATDSWSYNGNDYFASQEYYIVLDIGGGVHRLYGYQVAYDYDFVAGQQGQTTTPPVSLEKDHAIVGGTGGKLYSSPEDHTRFYEYDIAANSFTRLNDVPLKAWGCAFAELDGFIFQTGGVNDWEYYKDTFAYKL